MKYWALAMIVATASAPLITKPELVQVRDEPGRNPFQQTVANSTCELATTCEATFSAVPAHTRLVVTRFNASAFNTSGSNTMVYSVLTDSAENIVNTFSHTTPISGTSFVNESTLAYYEVPEAAVVRFLRLHPNEYQLRRVEEAWFKGLLFPAFNSFGSSTTLASERGSKGMAHLARDRDFKPEGHRLPDSDAA